MNRAETQMNRAETQMNRHIIGVTVAALMLCTHGVARAQPLPPTSGATPPVVMPQPGQAGEWEATGQATIVNNDRVRARERALDDAMRHAVQLAVASVVLPEAGGVQAESWLQTNVYPRARQFVPTYRVLEEQEQSGVLRLKIAAQVATDRIAQGLGQSLGRKAAKQRVLVCLAEPASDGAGARRVAAALAARGLDVAKMGDCAAILGNARGNGPNAPGGNARGNDPNAPGSNARGNDPNAPGGDARSDARRDDATWIARAQAAARAGGLAAVLVGRVEVAPAPAVRGAGVPVARALAHWLLVGGAGGAGDGSASTPVDAEAEEYAAQGVAAEVRAGAAAVESALAALEPALAARWPVGVAPGMEVRVHLDRVERWAALQALGRALGAVPGVTAVAPRRFAADGVELSVRTALRPADLAAALGRATTDGWRFAATPAGSAALHVTVEEAPPPVVPSVPPTGQPISGPPGSPQPIQGPTGSPRPLGVPPANPIAPGPAIDPGPSPEAP